MVEAERFNSLPWHDAALLAIKVDRSNAGNQDSVNVAVRWPDGETSDIIFEDCYLLDIRMNFGIIAEESILDAECLDDTELIKDVKDKWNNLGVGLESLKCFRILTNSTNSRLDIYALSFHLSTCRAQ